MALVDDKPEAVPPGDPWEITNDDLAAAAEATGRKWHHKNALFVATVRDRLRARVLASASEAVPVAWRTIETAPKDGTETLWFGRWRAHHILPGGQPAYALARWSTFSSSSMPDETDYGWVLSTGLTSGGISVDRVNVDWTHWMPLPAEPGSLAPPTASRERELVEALREIEHELSIMLDDFTTCEERIAEIVTTALASLDSAGRTET